MTREVHEIPPAPRKVRWRAVLWHWWPLAFIGFVLAIYGGAINYMLFLAYQGKASDNALLDEKHAEAKGTVTKIIRSAFEGGPLRVDYQFRDRHGLVSGSCLFPAGSRTPPPEKVGQPVDVEYSPTMSGINRIHGSRLHLLPPLGKIFFWTTLVPGLCCLFVWWLSVWRLRRLMATGDIGVCNIVLVRPIRIVIPSMFHVDYEFRDRHAKKRLDHHWVRARSELGERLESEPRQMAVVYDRRGRELSRMVMASDFGPGEIPNPVDPVDPGAREVTTKVMSKALLVIPEAPREPRWRACLRPKWVLGLVFGILFVISGILMLIFLGVGGGLPFDDVALDSQPQISHDAEILRIERTNVRINNARVFRLHFRFVTADGKKHIGSSTTRHVRHSEGGGCTVEYLENDPEVSRVKGTRRSAMGSWAFVLMSAFMLISFVGILIWLRSALSWRILLRDGQSVAAHILSAKTRPGVNPPQLVVKYEFEDNRGNRVRGRHCVPARSQFGKLLKGGLETAPVIFDALTPARSRLVVSSDFAATSMSMSLQQ